MTTAKEPPKRPKPASFFKSVISQLKPKRHSEAPTNKPSDQLADPAIGVLSDEPERRTSLNASASRCQFTFSDGRQCRNPAKVYPSRRNVYLQDELSPHRRGELSPVRDKKVVNAAHFCSQHSPKPKHGAKRERDASALEPLCADLTTATSINRALAQTFLLMAQGRISRKDAVAFGYLSQLLLQSVSGVRAEYVAAFGYDPWQEKLEESLAQDPDDDPGFSPENPGNKPDGVILSEQRERRISPEVPQEQPHAERIMGEPDFAGLYRRGRNLVLGKYDTTPEGRREANKLALDLELSKPAPAKPARDFIGRVADLQRTINAGLARELSPATIPPALDYYGRPIKMHVTPPSWEDEPDAQSSEPPSREISSPAGGTATPGFAPPSPSPSRSEPPPLSDSADFAAQPSRRSRKPRSRSTYVASTPHSELPSSPPLSSDSGPDADHHEGHQTDWYAPPSWSKTRPPDPSPNRQEKLRRKLRGVSNSAFRRLQHCNSRAL